MCLNLVFKINFETRSIFVANFLRQLEATLFLPFAAGRNERQQFGSKPCPALTSTSSVLDWC